jgi:hypothetical protein
LLCFCELIFFRASGTFLDIVGETRRVSERIVALEKASQVTDSSWSNSRRRRAIVLLQDRVQHIGEAVDGCQTSLMTMYSVMLPCNPLPGSFRQLLETFRMSQWVHLLIKLNLIAGANFALGWMRKWHPGSIMTRCLWTCLLGMRRLVFIWMPRYSRRGGLFRGCCRRTQGFFASTIT